MRNDRELLLSLVLCCALGIWGLVGCGPEIDGLWSVTQDKDLQTSSEQSLPRDCDLGGEIYSLGKLMHFSDGNWKFYFHILNYVQRGLPSPAIWCSTEDDRYGTYTIDGNQLITQNAAGDPPATYIFSISANTLTTVYNARYQTTMGRVDSSLISNAQDDCTLMHDIWNDCDLW